MTDALEDHEGTVSLEAEQLSISTLLMTHHLGAEEDLA